VSSFGPVRDYLRVDVRAARNIRHAVRALPLKAGAVEESMTRVLEDFLLFSCLAAFVTGVVIAAATLII
jgi:hypothetical protein